MISHYNSINLVKQDDKGVSMNTENYAFYCSLRKLKKIFFFIILLCFFLPTFAFGYVDPGSVSILLQVIVAFFLGGLITFKNKIIQLIKSLYHFFLLRR